MERGSVVEIRAMSGRVKRTDGANGGSVCSEVKQKEWGGGRRWCRAWCGNGCPAENGSVMLGKGEGVCKKKMKREG